MTNINTFFYHKKSGFLLLDIMISIALIGIFMLILGHYTFAIIEQNHEAQLTLQALNVATQQLDQCIRTRRLPSSKTQNIDPFSIAWHVRQDISYHLYPMLQGLCPSLYPFFIPLALQFLSKQCVARYAPGDCRWIFCPSGNSMKHGGGFSLLECMIYVLFLGVISVVFFSSTMRIYSTIRGASYKNHILLNLYTASDALARDIRLRPPVSGKMHYLSDGIVWHYGSQQLGWFLRDNYLVRFEGVYNKGSDSWSSVTKSVICNGITSVQFSAKESSAALSIILVSGSVTMERTIWL